MRSPLTMLRLTYPRVPSPKTVTSFQRVRSTHSPLLSRRLKLEATLTRSVEPTCLISPTRPMIVNSAIVFMSSILLSLSHSLLGPSAHAVGPSGCGSQEAGRSAPAPVRNERAGAPKRRTAEGGDFAARGIRPSGRRGKSSSVAVAAWLAWLKAAQSPGDQTDMSLKRPCVSLAFCASFSLCHLHFLNILCCA